MENLANTNQSSSAFRWLLLLLVFCGVGSVRAQSYFSRLYPNHSKAMVFRASSPHGQDGFMSVAMVVDSISNKRGLRFFRFDREGQEQASSFFELPPSYPPDFSLYLFPGCMTRVDDNHYVVLSELSGDLVRPFACLISCDSNCSITGFRELRNPFPGTKDTFLRSKGIGFDGTHLITMHYTIWGSNTSRQVLVKHDTALNMLWAKLYRVGVYSNCQADALTVSPDAYVVGGVSDNYLYEDDVRYRANAIVFKTDTSGTVLWTHTCPEFISTAPESIVQLGNGSFVYSSIGNVYYAPTSIYKGYICQRKLFQISKSGSFEKEVLFSSRFSSIGSVPIRLQASGDIFRSFYADEDTVDVSRNRYIFHLNIRAYDSSMKLMHSAKYYSEHVRDSTYKGRMGFYGPAMTRSGSCLISGYYEDYSGTVINPQQQGWIIKLDTNGCLGPDDPQCDPVSVRETVFSSFEVQVYPNPSAGILQFRGPVSAEGVFELWDMQGRLLRRIPVIQGACLADLSGYSPGMYFYVFHDTSGFVVSGKIVYAP